MKASIIGGGIAGLSTALALKQQNLDFDLYEAAPNFKTVGAGIILSPNALYIYDQLGISEQLERSGHPLPSFGLKTAQGKTIQSTPTSFNQHGKTYQSIGIHRAELQRILIENLPTTKIHLGKTLETLNLESSSLSFKDGETLNPDYIIAADGIHSKSRQSLFPNSQQRYSGQTCWRGISDITLSEQEILNAAEYWGTGIRFGYVPINTKQIYWYATAVQSAKQKDANPENTKQTLAKRFQNFNDIILQIIQASPTESIMKHDLYDITPLSHWHNNNTILIGDAAHAMTPNMGQGAAQSIEDAWALSHALKQNTSLKEAFENYTQSRYKKATHIAKLSWQIGQITNWQNAFLCGLRNNSMKLTPKNWAEKQRQNLFYVPSYA